VPGDQSVPRGGSFQDLQHAHRPHMSSPCQAADFAGMTVLLIRPGFTTGHLVIGSTLTMLANHTVGDSGCGRWSHQPGRAPKPGAGQQLWAPYGTGCVRHGDDSPGRERCRSVAHCCARIPSMVRPLLSGFVELLSGFVGMAGRRHGWRGYVPGGRGRECQCRCM